jgi:Rod binding domain-containing protein
VDALDPATSPLAAAGLLDTATLNAQHLSAKAAGRRQAVQAAKDFESVLLHRVLEEMRRTVPESGLLETGTSDQVQGLFYFYLAQEVAQKGGMGLWKELYRQINPQDKTPPELAERSAAALPVPGLDPASPEVPQAPADAGPGALDLRDNARAGKGAAQP